MKCGFVCSILPFYDFSVTPSRQSGAKVGNVVECQALTMKVKTTLLFPCRVSCGCSLVVNMLCGALAAGFFFWKAR